MSAERVTGDRKRILVVDDEADVRAYLSMALEDAGFEVATAADGLDALEKARQNPPDLISLDLVMPRHSGARCYHDLQKDKRLAKIPVLIVTGHARDQIGRADFEEMSMSGPGIYLEKPVSPESYVAAVRRLLGMESASSTGTAVGELRNQLSQALGQADEQALQRALDAIRKK
jgi:CheY-like chemotaxis protein